MEVTKDRRFLYRGVSKKQYEATNGRLVPKQLAPFEYTFKLDGTIKLDGSATLGPSIQNAVLRHQLKQEGFPTSGISTTPSFERAKFYATEGRREQSGYIFKIDRHLLGVHGVKEYIVAEWIPSPSIPEDREVILVARDFGALPREVVSQVIEL